MDFYYMPPSTPSRAVEMTALALGVELNKKIIHLMAGEHLKADYLKINPQHTIPTLVDGDLTLWESRAIMIYLCEKFDSSPHKWYPQDPKHQAVVNQRLYFDMGTLYRSFIDYYSPQITRDAPADPEKFQKVHRAFELLNTFLEGQQFVAGNAPTIADIAMVATVTTFDAATFNLGKYANVARWYELCKQTIPGYEANMKACFEFEKYYRK